VSITKPQLDKRKPAKFCQEKHRTTRLFWENNQVFYSTADFSFTQQRLVRDGFNFKGRNPTFRWAKKNDSIQVFHGFRSERNRVVSGQDQKISSAPGTNQIVENSARSTLRTKKYLIFETTSKL